jgi:hypothetical protein
MRPNAGVAVIAAAQRDEERLVELLEALVAELHKPSAILDFAQQALPLARRMAEDRKRQEEQDEGH